MYEITTGKKEKKIWKQQREPQELTLVYGSRIRGRYGNILSNPGLTHLRPGDDFSKSKPLKQCYETLTVASS